MSMTTEARRYHETYEWMDSFEPFTQDAIDAAYKAAVKELKNGIAGFVDYGDDRAEELIAAITKFVIECKRP